MTKTFALLMILLFLWIQSYGQDVNKDLKAHLKSLLETPDLTIKYHTRCFDERDVELDEYSKKDLVLAYTEDYFFERNGFWSRSFKDTYAIAESFSRSIEIHVEAVPRPNPDLSFFVLLDQSTPIGERRENHLLVFEYGMIQQGVKNVQVFFDSNEKVIKRISIKYLADEMTDVHRMDFIYNSISFTCDESELIVYPCASGLCLSDYYKNYRLVSSLSR